MATNDFDNIVNNDGKVKYYKFALGNTIVMEKDDLWYERDQEAHKWILNCSWMARYFDSQYDVIEINYDESKESCSAPRTIPGFSSVTMKELIVSVENRTESEKI